VRKDGVVLVDEVIEDRSLNLLGGVARFCPVGRLLIWEIAQHSETHRLHCHMCFYFHLGNTAGCVLASDGESGSVRRGLLTSKPDIG
jgi:hypothetical protein